MEDQEQWKTTKVTSKAKLLQINAEQSGCVFTLKKG